MHICLNFIDNYSQKEVRRHLNTGNHELPRWSLYVLNIPKVCKYTVKLGTFLGAR